MKPGVPVVPVAPATPALPPLPAAPTGGMAVPPAAPGGMGAPAVPPPMEFGPIGPAAPKPVPDPASLIPSPAPAAVPPAAPALPPLPAPGSNNLPPLPAAPSAPAAPMVPSISVVPSAPPAVVPAAPPAVVPSAPPGMLPSIDVTPKPNFGPPVGVGSPAAFTKPGGATEARPVVPEAAPKTDFDVDLYDPKANDSYDSISLEFYNDRRYAAALRAFNQNQALQGGRYVNVPPIHILKRRFPAQTGGVVTPVGGAGGAAPTSTPQWGPAGDAPPRAVNAGRGGYVVPAGGTTLKAVARLTLGNEQRWRDIYDLNPQVTNPDVLPAGTELKLPPDARLP